MEVLLQAGRHTHAQLCRERARLSAAHSTVSAHAETVGNSALALRLVADSRDAFAYYCVGRELGLRWNFSDPEMTRRMSHQLDCCAAPLTSRPLFGSAACVSSGLAELRAGVALGKAAV